MTEIMSLTPDAMARLMPMHVWLSPEGRIRRVGPTLQKLRPQVPLTDRAFLDVFDLRRPHAARGIEGLMQAAGARLHLSFRDPPATAFKGLILPLEGDAGALVNLSFGISVVEAVADHALTIGDFAATDLTVEMLYLVEAKSAVMEELKNLNLRLQGARIAAEEQAFTDTLTGLKNRRALDHILARLIEADRPFGLMHLDLDFFKNVNDSFGHAAGDHVLQQAARVLVEETREQDTVARAGGDEFVVIVDGPVTTAQLDSVARRIIERLERPILHDGRTCRISGSIGTALSTDYPRPEAERLLHDADMALYASKRAGRGCVTPAAGASPDRRMTASGAEPAVRAGGLARL